MMMSTGAAVDSGRCSSTRSPASNIKTYFVVTDVTISDCPPTTPNADCSGPWKWERIEKELSLHTTEGSAWLFVARANEQELSSEDLVVVDVRVGELPLDTRSDRTWEQRPGGIWLSRSNFAGNIDQVVTGLDVLFGKDAVDPRLGWVLTASALRLGLEQALPGARLSVLTGRAKAVASVPLRVNKNGRFRIVQISDTHMTTGVGACNDAIDAHGKYLPDCDADPLTVKFMERVLDAEKPDLVVLTGDQLHHDVPDTQTALFKVVAPMIERSIPFAAVFGNHDSEGEHALPRSTQMSLLQELPYSLCESGPEQVDGVGNYCIAILAADPSKCVVSDLYFLDSHSEKISDSQKSDYEAIKQSQIDWFRTIASSRREETRCHTSNHSLSLVFCHIPIPEYGSSELTIHNGARREPTESPSVNSHFYDALAEAGVSALACGHDHVNDFCALLNSEQNQSSGPWLCYGGGSGFGGYCSRDGQRYHRRVRVWELDPSNRSLQTWKRIEYHSHRSDELMLVDDGIVRHAT